MNKTQKASVFVIGLTITLVGAFCAAPVYALVDIGASTSMDGVSTDQSSFLGIGKASADSAQAGMYYRPAASHNVCTVSFLLAANGSPIDALKLDLKLGTTTSGYLTSQGSLVQSADSHIQIRSSTLSKVTYTFTPCAVVVGANDYFFALYRDGAYDSSNYYRIGFGASATYFGTGNKNVFLYYNAAFSKTNCATNCTDLAINGTENFGAIAPSTTPQFAQSVINTLLGINENNATSTLTDTAGGWTNIPSFFAKKVPWGYIFDIADTYNNAATSSTDFSSISIDFANSGASTNTRQWLPSRFTFFSTTTVTYYMDTTTLNALNTLLSIAGWIAAIGYWYKRGLNV